MSAFLFVDQRLQHSRAERRRLQRRARFPHAPSIQKTTSCLYSLRHIGGDTPVVLYLRMKWKEASAASMTDESLLDVAKRLHDCCTAAEKTAWRYPRNEREEKVMNAAHKHLAEHRLVRWILRMNLMNGVAPKGEDIAEAYASEYSWRGMPWIRNDAAVVQRMRLPTQRKWAERLRRQWHLKIGTLKVETPMLAGEVERKVSCFE